MPCYGLPLAVFIGSEPDGVGFFSGGLELRHQLFFLVGHLVVGREPGVDVDAEVFFAEVANVSVARHDLEVRTEEFFDGLCLGGRFDYDEIFHLAERGGVVEECEREQKRLPGCESAGSAAMELRGLKTARKITTFFSLTRKGADKKKKKGGECEL